MKLANIIATATALLQADFDEASHARDEHGKFASTGTLKETTKTHFVNKDYDPQYALDNKQLREVKKPDFDKYTNSSLHEPDMELKKGQKASAGVIVIEPGNKTWIISPKNYFGGYRNVFPKGTQDKGEALQKTALREVWEETGMVAKITGYLGDVQRSTSVARYYVGERVSGSPAKAGPETHAVKMVDIHDQGLHERLNDVRGKPTPDQKVLGMLRNYLHQRDQDVSASWQPCIEVFDDVCASCESGDCELHAGGPGSGRHKDLVYFHGTPSKNVENIMKEGLKPNPNRSDRAGGGYVYLTPKLATAHYFGNSGSGETGKYVVLKVTVPADDAAKVEKDPIHPYKSDKAVRIKGTVLPSQISISSINPTRHSTRSSEDFEDVTAGGPGSGRHSVTVPVLKEGQRGVGKSDGAVFPVHGPKSNLPGRHFSHGQYTKSGNGWTAPNKKTGGTLTVERKNNPDGSAQVTRYTTYKQGGQKEVTQPSEVLQYPDKQSADAHMMKRFGITAGGPGSGRHRGFHVFIDKAYFPKELHPKKIGQTAFEQWHGVPAGSRAEAAQTVWQQHGERLKGLMNPNASSLPRKISLHVDSPDAGVGGKAGRLQPILVEGPQVKAAISAREDRIRAFALDALQCDFDESLHPRDKGGKFASKGESGAQPITPAKKMAQLNQMGFQYKGSHLDESGKVTKDVFEKIGTLHEVHVSKYNTSHPGNADLRKYAVVDKLAGKTLQQGHQISKVQDFVNNNHLSGKTPTAPVQTPVAPKAAPAWKVGNGGTTSTAEGKALQNAGFTYQSTTGGGIKSEDMWTHPSGAYVKVMSSGFKVASANGTEEYKSGPANHDFDGTKVQDAIGKAVADSQAVKNAPTEPVTVPTGKDSQIFPWSEPSFGKMPADDKISSKSEQQTLTQQGFNYSTTFADPDKNGQEVETWNHPSGTQVQITKDGYEVYDKQGKVGSGGTVYETIGKLDKPIKDAIDNAGKASTGLANPGGHPNTPGLANHALTSLGFSPAGTKQDGETDVWTHSSGHTLEYNKSGSANLKDPQGKVLNNYDGVVHNKEAIQADLNKSPGGGGLTVHSEPQNTMEMGQSTLENTGFKYTGTKADGADVWTHPNGITIEYDGKKHGDDVVTIKNLAGTTIAKWGGVSDHVPELKNVVSQPAGAAPQPAAVSIKPAPAGVEPNKAGFKQNYYKQEGFVFTGKGPYDADVWKHPSGVTVQVMSTKHNVLMPGEAKKSYQGTPTSWDMKQYVSKAQLQTPAQPAAPVSKSVATAPSSILHPSMEKALTNNGFVKQSTVGNTEVWKNSNDIKMAVSIKGGGFKGNQTKDYKVYDKYMTLIKSGPGAPHSGGILLSTVKDAIDKASTPPVDHPTKAAGPVVPASGKNTALTGEGYQFQKHENGSDYWTKPGAAYGVKITATDATHSGFDVIQNTTGAVYSSGKDAGAMISTLSQVNGPKPSPQAQQYVPPTPIPAGPKKDWTENTDKAWQQKARDTVASLWSKAPDSAKAYTNNPTGVYNDIAKALGVPFSRLQEVKDRIGSWQGGTTVPSGGNKIGNWAQDIVNNRDQVHPGLFIEHLVTQERIKEQYGGVVPTLYRGLHSPGDPESAGSGPAKGNIGVLKGLAQMSGEGFHTNFPVYGAEGFSSAKSVSTSFSSGSGVVITKAKGNLPSNWIMTSRDINPGMWTGYAGEHEWAVACPEVKDSKTGTMIPKLPIDTEKGDHVQGAGVVNAAMDPEEAENRVFELLANLKQSGWDYSLDGKEITVYPPVGWTNAAWFAEARKPQTAITASEEKPVRRMMIPGLPPISIEYEMGQTRTGTDKNGRVWSQVMPYAYGRFTGTKGLDGEPVDVILGRNPQSKKVFVACLPKNLGNEEKVMVGFDTIQQAKIAFLACYGYQSKYLQTIGEITKPLLMTLMKVKNGKSAMLQQPREVKIAAEADYFESTPGLNVLPTSRPPSLKNHVPVDDPLATDGWHQDDSAQSKQQAREDMARIVTRTSRQTGKPEIARTADMNYQNPYPDVLL